jgi:transcription elongation factor Elf1
MNLLLTKEETQKLPVEEINTRITKAFKYDEYTWQKEKKVRVKDAARAEGLHKVLYQCPACKTEYKMATSKATLRCESCGKTWEMSEYGELRALSGETEFSHIPDWYEWERANVRQEVAEGTYSQDVEMRIESLPNAKGFVVFSEAGNLTHNMEGFNLTGAYDGESFDLTWAATTMHSCHIEYNYMGRGDCIDLNTTDDTFYLFPKGDNFAVTKIALATEELYNQLHQR